MKNLRLYYTKTGKLRFVSHLDMNRLITRIIRKSGIPVWYTEGFNQHIYINYAVPLSLGFEGFYEIMDIKLTDDKLDNKEVIRLLNEVSTDGLEFIKAEEPILAMKNIAYAKYIVEFENADREIVTKISEFCKLETYVVPKKDKKGRIKDFDIMPKIKTCVAEDRKITLILSSGNEGNLNPAVIISAFNNYCDEKLIQESMYNIRRVMIYDYKMNEFK